MLEKIGLPSKPSLRGNNWVVDATQCQGCSYQFTFINRKHHCRRCGGLFCNGCTQQRMVLRGQGDTPVRICEPCKKLEEAARFEMRYGHKNRAGKGSSRLASKSEDEVLHQILGNEGIESSWGQNRDSRMVSAIQRAGSSSSGSIAQEAASLDGVTVHRSSSIDESIHLHNDVGPSSPEELRQRALDEKKMYKALKSEGKSDEALKAFKRGKELERQADALELSIRKNRRKPLLSGNRAEIQNKDGPKESGRKSKLLDEVGKEKVDLTAELRELGLSDMDLHDEDKKSANMSLEGELFSLLGENSKRTNKETEMSGIDKTPVIAHKRKALAFKREGKLAEAKEELKKAKLLEKQLEEQELLGVAEESDDEISALIHSMDNDKHDELLVGHERDHGLNFDHLTSPHDDLHVDGNLEVTDEDMVDPEIAFTLKSLGWIDDPDSQENSGSVSVPINREALLSEILSLKREALNQKQAGNVAEAMAQLKKAKLLERNLESLDGEEGNVIARNTDIQENSNPQTVIANNDVDSKIGQKNKLMLQRELLVLKKKALALRREGRLDEAEEELRKGRVLEQQLEDMDGTSKTKVAQVTVGGKDPDLKNKHHDTSGSAPVGGDGEDDVTDQDMHDPTYLSLLRNLGWNDDDNDVAKATVKPLKEKDNHFIQIDELLVSQASSNTPTRTLRSKAEIQRELLHLKRKALALRREGKTGEAEELLETAKTLEAQMDKLETKKEISVESNWDKDGTVGPLGSEGGEGDADDVTDNDMHDPSLLSMLANLGWKDEGREPGITQSRPSNRASASLVQSTATSLNPPPPSILVVKSKCKSEIQRELLGLKRKALALRRRGEIEEAEELLKMAKVLEAQMEDANGPKREVLPDVSKEQESGNSESLSNHEKQATVENAVEKSEKLASVALLRNEKYVESFMGLGREERDSSAPPSRSLNSFIHGEPQLIEGNHPLLGELDTVDETGSLSQAGTDQVTGFMPQPDQNVNVMDLLTGDDWRIPSDKPVDKVNSEPHVQLGPIQKAAENLGNKAEVNPGEGADSVSGSGVSCLPEPHVHLDYSTSPPNNLGNKDIRAKKRELVNEEKQLHMHEPNSVLAFQNNKTSLQQEILARKRKAVALKRDGKLTEAREELRQAKLLEKGREEETREPETAAHGLLTAASTTLVRQKDPSRLSMAPKPLSGRDRFKLQQQSLSHKRQALKLRREGRVEEADAEFELAKTLEAQLEESTSQDSMKTSNAAESADVVVEDLLDPQLLSALKAIGIDDANIVSQGRERPSMKVNPGEGDNISQQRTQLEEQIKAAKFKAANLKRSGKQAEALDALRRAKLFEKKLNSLSST